MWLKTLRRRWFGRSGTLQTRAVSPGPRRARLGVERLEERVVLNAEIYGGLEFQATQVFQTSPAQDVAAGLVQVGVAPQQGASFTPLLDLQDGVQFNPSLVNGNFTTKGSVSAVSSGTSIPLLDNHAHAFSPAALLSAAGFTLPSSDVNTTKVAVAEVNLAVTNLALTASAVNLQGTLTFPVAAGLSVPVTGQNHVVIDSAGVSLTGVAPATATEHVTVDGLTFATGSLAVSYVATSNQGSDIFTFTGNVSTTLGPALSPTTLDLGGNQTAGLVIQQGVVASLGGFINVPSIIIAGVPLAKPQLEMDYLPGSKEFGLSGSATIQVPGASKPFAATFGSPGDPGILIQNGTVTQFDFSVPSGTTFNLGGMTIDSQSLTGAYAPSTKTYTFSGAATLSYGTIVQNIPVQFGNGGTGITIQNGLLTGLAGPITGAFTIAGVTIQPQSMKIAYLSKDFVLFGFGTLSFGADSFMASFGGAPISIAMPGNNLVLGGGTILAMNTSLIGSLDIMGFAAISTGLSANYDASTRQIALSGGVSVALASNLQANLTISRDGLEVDPQSGALAVNTANGLNLDGNVPLGQFKALGLDISWAQTKNQLTMSADANILFPGNFQVPSTWTFTQNQLTAITFNYASNTGIALGQSGLVITAFTGQLDGLNNLAQDSFSGTATVQSKATMISQGRTSPVVSVNGTVTPTSSDFQISGPVNWLNGPLGSAPSGTLDLQWNTGLCVIEGDESFFGQFFATTDDVVLDANGAVTLLGTANVTLPPGLPAGVYGLLGAQAGQTVDHMNFYLQIRPGEVLSQSYATAWVQMGIVDGSVKVALGGSPFTRSGTVGPFLTTTIQAAFNAGVAATASQLLTAGDGASATASALETAYSLGPVGVAQALHGAGFGDGAIGTALNTVFGETDAQAAVTLEKAGFDAADAALVLTQGFQDNVNQVAQNLAQAGYSIGTVALAFYDQGVSASAAFAALEAAYSLPVQDIVNAMFAAGVGYLPVDIALVLQSNENFSALATAGTLISAGIEPQEVALIIDCFYNVGVQGTANALAGVPAYGATQVVQALRAAFDLAASQAPAILMNAGYDATAVATAMLTVYGTKAAALAQEMQQAGFAAADAAAALQQVYKITLAQQAAQDLAQAKYKIADVAAALQAQYKVQELNTLALALQQAGYKNTDIGALLNTQYKQTAAQMSQILHEIQTKGGDIVSVLQNSYGETDPSNITQILLPLFGAGPSSQFLQQAGFSASDVAQAVASVAGLTAGEVAAIFYDILTFPVNEVAAALGGIFQLSDSAVGSVMHAVGYATSLLQTLGSDFVAAFDKVKDWFESTF